MTSDTYAKLFQAILTSSIWSEDDKTRIMWVTMLALCDRDGYVTGTIPGLAAMARMSISDAEKSVLKLTEPDRYSRTADHEGRRIEQTDGGWLVLNYIKYREIGSKEGRKASNAERQRRFRERHKSVTESNDTVTPALRVTLQSNDTPILIPVTIPIGNNHEGGCKGETKKTYGEFGNVKLTADERQKLVEKHGVDKTDKAIEALGAWLESTGKKRKNHYAAMNASSWVWEKIGAPQSKPQRNQI